ncbi:translation elongation factor Ts [Saprolegnia diclina VS20]|uniref:Elongation factor Ts, mitochondrial n=1 Tax=Saprolegnia diclina (strain VS20) TaxID=1156394 RepID=T0SDX7_SAPDV|nr:translation elongation factor Ts [Saprolegnia diclina VS20]EQC41062.1 translation elongation factor Ts [Saprolegnia diclina VS20]|eukprot:XP_008605906.1 translation elongation factor Ts [Saprolegnia diclina VS20]
MLRSTLFARRVVGLAGPSSLRSMATYSPSMEEIKKLRTASQAPMKDVKKALVEAEGDFPAAFEWLRKKGIASATAKAGRTAAEGLVGIFVDADKKRGAMVEVNSETDFVARNDQFQALVAQVTRGAHAGALLGELDTPAMAQVAVEGRLVADLVPELVGRVGENIVVQRGTTINVEHGVVSSYTHRVASQELNLGRAGALVGLEVEGELSSAKVADLEALGKKLAMHVVAAKPKFLNRDAVPAERVEAERAFVLEQVQVQATNKPANIVEKMVDGRMNKFFGEVTLVDQVHMVEEGNPKVSAHLEKEGARLGLKIKLSAFQRYEIGEEQL